MHDGYPVRLAPTWLGLRWPAFQGWVEGWWSRKVKPSDAYRFHYRSVFVMPTGSGVLLVVTVLILLVASINYQLNLGYMLTFSLAGSGLVAMFGSCINLWGLTVKLGKVRSGHVGELMEVDVVLSNASKKWRYGLDVGYASGAHRVAVDLCGEAQERVELSWVPSERGFQALPMVIVESRFPIGVTRAWGHWRPATKVLVYPKPEVNAPEMPLAGASTKQGSNARRDGQEDFDALRPYKEGDRFKFIDWKRSSRFLLSGQGALVSRQYSSPNSDQMIFTLDDVRGLDTERAISRLTAWVLRAHEQGSDFGLSLPGVKVALGSGADHKARCLEALAKV